MKEILLCLHEVSEPAKEPLLFLWLTWSEALPAFDHIFFADNNLILQLKTGILLKSRKRMDNGSECIATESALRGKESKEHTEFCRIRENLVEAIVTKTDVCGHEIVRKKS